MLRYYSSFLSALMREGLSDSAVAVYVSAIRDFLRWKTLFPDQCYESYVLYLLRCSNYSVSYINNRIAAINKYHSLFYPNEKPLKYISFPDNFCDSSIDDSAIKNLLKRIKSDRERIIVLFMLYGGLGYYQLRNMTKSNIDLINQCIYTNDITLPLHTKLVPILNDFLEKRASKNHHLFYYRGPMSSSGLYRIVSKYNTNSVKFTPTNIRRTFFCKLIKLNVFRDIIFCLYSLKPDYYNLLNYNELVNAINKVDW